LLQGASRLGPLPPNIGKAEAPDETHEYDAFISYSRKDRAFARLLEQRLEAYRPPKGLGVPKRNLRVFLDSSDIRGLDYNESIDSELRRSRTLIVVCSPAARASKFVEDEIRRFIAAGHAQGREPQILPLLLQGIPNNEARSTDDEERKAFPEALYDAVTMPLAQSFLDFDPKRHKLDRGGYRDSWFATLATLLDAERHALEERDARRERRTRRFIASIALTVAAVVSGLAVVAWLQRGEFIAQRDKALRQESRALAELAQSETRAGNAVNGMLLALRGMPIAEERPLITETRLALWDATVAIRELLVLGGPEAISGAAFSPDGTRIMSAERGGTIRVWDAASGAELLVLRANEDPDFGWHDLVAFSPDGARIMGAYSSGRVRVWNASSGEELLVLPGHEGDGVTVAFSRDGARFVTAAYDNSVWVWDAVSGADLFALRGHEELVTAAAFSPDGARIVSGSWDGTVRVWDAASGAEQLVLRGHEGSVTAAAFSPDGARIVSASADKTIRVWNAGSGEELLVLRGHEGEVWAAAFSPDGARIVSVAGDGQVWMWDAASGVGLSRYLLAVISVAFSPDGSRGSVAEDDDNTVLVVDVASGKIQMLLRGHQGPVIAAAFSPDGARIVSGSLEDGTIRVWDAVTGAGWLILRGNGRLIKALAFSPDGARVVSGAGDGTVRVWFVGEAGAAHTCARLPRDLSPEAIKRFNLDPDAPWPCAERAAALWPHSVATAIAPAAGPEEDAGAAAPR
jgi:WD40 repeat protein